MLDVSKRANIGKYSPYRGNIFREKQPFGVENKDKPREKVAEMSKKKNSCHNWGSIDRYDKNFSKEKKKIYAIGKVPEEEIQAEDLESDSLDDTIIESFDDDQELIEEFLVEYQEKTQLEIKDIQLGAGIPQDNSKNLVQAHTISTNLPSHTR
ncbi:hypothetical protein O181_011587 [Austropuccinia psidii MF-1]|uniref:Uncharacterized protein n=1 Tax=Austropuccinia psidii MF-1 TaxID=1389203 RepID=A0A9Q3BW03_9BASI|nr:hypothetical protein [Austropuccinia psidii MF-1]